MKSMTRRLRCFAPMAAAALAAAVGTTAQSQTAEPTAAATPGAATDPSAAMRYRLQHGHELAPTAGVHRSDTPRALPLGRQATLDGVRFEWPADTVRSFADYRAGNVLDGFLVLKNGRIVFEQ